jgi:hypothetical protein
MIRIDCSAKIKLFLTCVYAHAKNICDILHGKMADAGLFGILGGGIMGRQKVEGRSNKVEGKRQLKWSKRSKGPKSGARYGEA